MSGPFRPERLRTVQLVPLTAFDERGRLNLDVMRLNTRRLFEAGLRVFIPCAGSSEFHSLTADEVIAAVRMTREVVGAEAVVMAPIGLQIGHALKIGRGALDAGADCLLVMPLAAPYLSDAGAADYYLALLDDLACPTLIYKKSDIPSDGLLLELADHPQVIGVKYAVNDVDAFSRAVANDDDRIDWFCGSAERYAPFFMLAGATGYTSGAGNLCPHLTLAMFEACASGDWPQAMRLLQLIRPIEDYRARSGSSYNISFLKYAMRGVGLDFGEPRPPQRRLTEAERREIDALLPPILEAEAELAETPQAVR
jgi:4-hydroxy-tetrahydrodipicolinate synthase